MRIRRVARKKARCPLATRHFVGTRRKRLDRDDLGLGAKLPRRELLLVAIRCLQRSGERPRAERRARGIQ